MEGIFCFKSKILSIRSKTGNKKKLREAALPNITNML